MRERDRIQRALVTNKPATELVPLTDLETLLRVNGEDDFMKGLIVTAREMVEELTSRQLGDTTFTAYLDRIPYFNEEWWDGERTGIEVNRYMSEITLQKFPLISVTSFITYDLSDVASTFDPSNYYVDASSLDFPGRIVLRIGSTWPLSLRIANSVQIIYHAGYTAANVPRSIKSAILRMAAYLYANRGDCDASGCACACGAMALLSNYMPRRV